MRHWSRLPILMLLLVCTSCAPMSTVDQALQRHKTLLRIAVTIGVGRFLTDYPQHAALVYQVAHGARQALSDGTIDVTQIVPVVLAQLPASPGIDQDLRLLLEVLVQAVASEVQAYLAQAQLPGGQVPILVSEVLGWIEDAASVRLGGKPPVQRTFWQEYPQRNLMDALARELE